MARKRERHTYSGSDGKPYRGKAIKARKRLEARQRQHEADIKTLQAQSRDTSGYRMPGSMKIK